MLSVKELANLLGVSPKTVYAMCDQRAIPYYRVGNGRGTLRFELDEVKTALKPRESTFRPPDSAPGRHLQ